MCKKLLIFFILLNLIQSSYSMSIKPLDKLAIFEPGKEVVFRIEKAENDPEIFTYTVVDYFDKIHQTGRFDKGCELKLTGLVNGYYELIVEEKGDNNKKIHKQPFAVIPLPDKCISKDKNQFGAMVIPHTGYPIKDKELDVRFMDRIGIRWVRTHRLNWKHIQRTPDAAFDWRQSDAEVELYNKYGLGIVATTCWPIPGWASSGAGTSVNHHMKSVMTPSAEYMPKLEAFCQELASRYQGKVDYYEIGNEVDASNFWQGSAVNSATGNSKGIMKDYCNFFLKMAKALKAGDPNSKVAPNTTGMAPDGHTYKPWLQTMYKLGIAKEMNLFSTHYLADVDKIREVMKKNGQDLDIIFTEIGGHVRTEKNHDSKQNYEKMIKTTYVHYGTILNKGGKALCKFLLRDIPAIKNPPWIAGMLTKDFKIRPELIAYATLIRMLAGAEPVKELNITKCSDNGWVQGFAFQKNGQVINIIWLQDADHAKVSLKTNDKTVKIVDVMGQESMENAENGELVLAMKKMYPIFIVGNIIDNPGPVEHPKPQIVKSVKLKLNNAGFEAITTSAQIPNWGLLINEVKGTGQPVPTFRAFVDKSVSRSGKQALCLEASKESGWYGVISHLPLSSIPKPKTGQYVEFIINYDLKAEHVKGIGSGVTLAFRNKKMLRVDFKCGNWTKGTFDWEHKVFKAGSFERFHPETETITLELYLGKSTGKVWIDNVEVTVNLWQRCGAEARIVN